MSTTMPTTSTDSSIFERRESVVRSYCRGWPTVFDRARGAEQIAEDGTHYLDFFAGAGALNYGHNHPVLKKALADYLAEDRLIHSMDMYSVSKREFLETFEETILKPRGMDHRVQFPGPTGTNAVETALKIARKVTGRTDIVSFTNAFHGMTLGSLAVTGNSMKREGAGTPLYHATTAPYDDYLSGSTPDFQWLERVWNDSGSGLDIPAAVIVETVQGEGGLNAARMEWLRALEDLCHRFDVKLIVDDIQAGCGRTGTFFSFEPAGITPDIVCLSKSLSGLGLPFAAVLLRPELDQWQPGEHNGTFRGFNPAFVTGAAALKEFWQDDSFAETVRARGEQLGAGLERLAALVPGAHYRGRGLLAGVYFPDVDFAGNLASAAFERGLLVETAGPDDEVLKTMPPLTVTEQELARGLDILIDAAREALPKAA